MTDNDVPPNRKLDPETLALRGSPMRPIRFRRGAIVGIAAAGSLVVLIACWLALRPGHAATAEGASDKAVALPNDALAKAPASYSNTPRLGPPLPGDLGKSVMELERSRMNNNPGVPPPTDQGATARKTALGSGLLAQLPAHQGMAPTAPTVEAGGASVPVPVHNASASGNDLNAQDRKLEFAFATDTGPDVNRYPLEGPASPTILSAGSIIAASLITGLRSDLPGIVVAQVTDNVYDSASGATLLVPQGSRLIGAYDSGIAYGQSRAQLVWQRIVLPDGSSLRMDNVPATDASGYAGLSDRVDFHGWMLLKGAALSTLLGVSSDLALRGRGEIAQAIRLSTQDSVSRAGDQITSRNLEVQPTITIRPGARVRLIVHRDLILPPWKEVRP